MASITERTQRSSISGGANFGSTTVYNPGVPFLQRNLGTVQAGKLVYISGIPSHNPERITIKFESGQDIPFCFDVRFNYGGRLVLVRTTFQNNRWQPEERALNGAFPFKSDTFFDMIILIDASAFKVAVNNKPLLDFRHRMPFQGIDTLFITGDVRLCQVRF